MKIAKYKHYFKIYSGFLASLTLFAAMTGCALLRPAAVTAQELSWQTSLSGSRVVANDFGKYACGTGEDRVVTSIDFGCRGTDCLNNNRAGDSFCVGNHSGIIDLMFAIIRFLSAGVGIVVIASIIFAGIQYTTSRGDPNAAAAAMKRIQNTALALALYIFGYAILNYLIPEGFFY